MSLINDALKRTKQNQQQPDEKPVIPGAGSGLPLQPVDERNSGSNRFVWITVLLILIIAGIWFMRRGTTTESAASGATGNVQSTQPDQLRPSNPIERAAATAQKWADRQDDQTTARPASTRTAPGAAPLSVTVKAEPAKVAASQAAAESPSKISTQPVPAAQPTVTAESASSTTATPKSAPAALSSATSASRPEAKPGDPATSSVGTTSQPVSVPVVPASAPPPPAPEMKLQGIFFRLKKPSALINGRTVTIGDDVDGARVISIDRQSVKLMISGKTSVLTLR
ncbi:MAG: hypothetical protein EXS31_08630 [Pedosphaera sp.]|nr:hypothetical protein [Pedosphaera sp.]